MLLKTSLGSAYVHNIDLIDKSKEIILFIPGAGMDHRVADLLHPDPKIFNKVLSIDLPGHGNSDFSPVKDRPCLSYPVNEVLNLLDKLEINEYNIIGHSLGGYIACEYAHQFPQNLSGLGLIHSTSLSDGSKKKENRKKAINFIKKHGTDDFFQLFIKNLVAENNQLLIPKNLVHVIKNTPKNSIINGMKAMMNRPDRKHILSLIDYPILFIVGDKDEHYPKHEIFNQASICKLAQVNVIENSGHLSMMENEKDFLDAIQQFILIS